jgi:hypothetical protein
MLNNLYTICFILVCLVLMKGARGSLMVKALCYNLKVAGSRPDEVTFFKFA